MKKVLAVFCTMMLLFSCSSDDKGIPLDLIGTWKLQEINNDPGDGSGTFQKVESNKTLIFKKNLEITSNGSLSENTIDSNSSSHGVYRITENSEASGIITPSKSKHLSVEIHFEIKNSVLYVYYPCIEGCVAKYTKK
ncbi:hypothetical protein FACS1894179_09380 [Bacteroidia bacterium]|nr:hypothetical protein FACS1894169_16290 [Bacteroidia bacterium]GHV41401.1 hypothetical protein FACS1894179_09380 [Bacteroidia bacterium]